MASFEAELELELSNFRKSIEQAKKRTSDLAKHADKQKISTRLFKGLASAARNIGKVGFVAFASITTAATVATAAISAGVKKAFDLGGRLSDVAAQIGDTAGAAQLLETAFAQNDKGSVDAFQSIARAINAIENPTERAARAMQIFGRSGGELMALFSNPEAINTAAQNLGGQAQLLTENANKFDRASDILASMGAKLQGLWVGVGSEIIDQVLLALEKIDKIDFSDIGVRLGNSLNKAFAFFHALFTEFTTSEIFSLIGDQLTLSFKQAVNFLNQAINAGEPRKTTHLSSA